MNKLLQILTILTILTATINAKENEAKKLCDAEIKKEVIDKSIVKEQCIKVAKIYEHKKNYGGASWYYLLSGNNRHNINTIDQLIQKNFSNIAHSYILNNEHDKAKELYIKFLKDTSIPWADKATKDDYKLLFKLYPNHKEELIKGLKLWNEIYKPLLAVNELYPKYKKARKEKKYKEAIKHLIQVIELQKEYQVINTTDIRGKENSLSVMYFNNGQYPKSLEILKKIEKGFQKNTVQQKEQILILENIADIYKKLDEYDLAADYYNKVILIKEMQKESNENIIYDYQKLSLVLYKNKKYKKAIESYKKFILFQKELYGVKHELTIKSYKVLVSFYYMLHKEAIEANKYVDAISTLEAIIQLLEKYMQKESIEIYDKKYYLGTLYYYHHEYEASLSMLNEVEEIYEKRPDRINEYSILMGFIANNYSQFQKFDIALEYYKKSIKIKEKNLGKSAILTAESYQGLGGLYLSKGDYIKAKEYFKEALNINKKLHGPNHLRVSSSYNDMGLLYQTVGNYTKAFYSYQLSLEILEKLDKYNISKSSIYNNLGSLYLDLEDFSKALEYQQKALKIKKRYLDEADIDMATSYNSLSGVFSAKKDHEKALNYSLKSLNIIENNLGLKHLDVATAYDNVGLMYKNIGNFSQAMYFYKKSLSIREDILSKDNIITTNSYFNIASLYDEQKNHLKALKYLKKCLHAREDILGIQHPDTVDCYTSLSLVYMSLKDYTKMYFYAKKAFSSFLMNKENIFVIMDNIQKKKYMTANKYRVVLLLYSATKYVKESTLSKLPNKLELFREILSDWLNYKGSIYDSENSMILLYEQTNNPKIKDKIKELSNKKRFLAQLYQTLPKLKERKSYQQRIKDTETTISDLERYIGSKASSFKEELGLRTINYKDISKNLKEDEIYIDYAKVGDYYYIFTLDNKDKITFNQVNENDTKSIDTNVKAFREDIDTILNASKLSDEDLTKLKLSSKEKLSTLYNLVLNKPLKEILPKYSKLIISSDGALRLLPFETMVNSITDKYLIQEKTIRYIPSGKELVRLYRQKTTDIKEKIVLFNNPNFDAKDITTLAKVDTLDIPSTTHSRAGIIKSLFKMRFVALPGTKEEVKNIKQTLNTKDIQEYEQEEAKEENLLKIDTPKILHIATHGFFINDDNIPNPMLKSGIALSGANASAIRGKSDGIVTSLKLSGLNLKGTELVVLSACQTGVVDINSTENVSGLNKAFIQAGAKNIVMSLWSVADKETSDLMSGFYTEMKNTPDYAQALRDSKLKMIEQDLHPFYWAPFIISGVK